MKAGGVRFSTIALRTLATSLERPCCVLLHSHLTVSTRLEESSASLPDKPADSLCSTLPLMEPFQPGQLSHFQSSAVALDCRRMNPTLVINQRSSPVHVPPTSRIPELCNRSSPCLALGLDFRAEAFIQQLLQCQVDTRSFEL
ncbi:unnamed protein product [Effrenium voratum]|uniref:Uncharacterized protein n=1 Tax=Effrenium voratum TaxID=2562239 RepID=A0AA36JCP5_9DINO|nr:unnamed protein product [Effrenium voratum]CAJ1420429.1 unnamed protein product [Effrenium voratum]